MQVTDTTFTCLNFTFFLSSHTGALDAAAARIQELEDEIKKLTTELSQLKVCQVHFHRFCFSDKDILFYTRFMSRDVFCKFWEAIQPSASVLVVESSEKGKHI